MIDFLKKKFGKEEEQKQKPQNYNEKMYALITIHMTGTNKVIQLECEMDKPDQKKPETYFKDFYKWWFGRPQSENYRIEYGDGDFLIQRKDIVYVHVFRQIRKIPK